MDLDFLKSLYENAGDGQVAGYVSVYLDTSPATESAAKELELRWRAGREELAAEGVSAPALDAVGRHLTGRKPSAPGQAVFAHGGMVRLTAALPRPPRQEISRYAALPHVMPLLAQLPQQVPHVRVGADRTGGRVLTVSASGATATSTITGQTWPVHKTSRKADYSRQRSTEEAWAENGKLLADAVTRAAEQVRAEFVVVGGDEWERSTLLGLLPTALRDAAVVVDREVEPDGAAFTAAAEAERARRAEQHSQARLDEFWVRMNEPDITVRRAVEGLDATLAALRDGLAEGVLVRDDPARDEAADPAAAWIGPGLADVATDPEQLVRRGVADPVMDRADAALARAACGTGATLSFIPGGADLPVGWVGALLRAPLAAVR
ncbi:MAG TPA: hypothetical protein VMG38_11580 [Trebonia sp.]|nr:hypothetical protein [Trebonia sp.]